MLNRRHLRVKVLQGLYAFFQSGGNDLPAGERELMHGMEKVYDMYLYQLSLLAELRSQELKVQEENRHKQLPTKQDLDPAPGFIDNIYLQLIAQNQELAIECANRKIGWADNEIIARKLLAKVKSRDYYKKYIENKASNPGQDLVFVVKLIMKDMVSFELLHSFYEDNSIYWIDDWELVNLMITKSLKAVNLEKGTGLVLMQIFKEENDRVFAIDLFRKTILQGNQFEEIISRHARNWEMDRIAVMDMIIMKMGLVEISSFPGIPFKVSLNEYIELSKMYSSPKSKVFVNGILDKVMQELVSEGTVDPKLNE